MEHAFGDDHGRNGRQQAERGREQGGAELLGGQVALLGGTLVVGEFVHHRDDGRHVLGTRRPDRRCLGSQGHAFLVSQKIFEISSIFCSSSSARAGSTVPFAPEAPASLVASLNSWCRCGYFSKWAGLK